MWHNHYDHNMPMWHSMLYQMIRCLALPKHLTQYHKNKPTLPKWTIQQFSSYLITIKPVAKQLQKATKQKQPDEINRKTNTHNKK